MSLDNRNPSTGESNNDDPFAILLADYMEGTLSEEKTAEIKQHLTACIKCSNLYRSLLQAGVLTAQVKHGKSAFIGSVSEETRQYQMDRIKQRIRNERDTIQENQQADRKRLVFPIRRWTYASTAAGFAVLILVIALFIRMDPFGATSKTADFNGQMSQATAEVDNNYGYDDSSTRQSADDYNNEKASDAETAVNGSGQTSREWVSDEATGPVHVVPEYSDELLAAMQGLTAYLEIHNETDSYLAIAAFPSASIQSKSDTIGVITKKVSQMGFTAKIEIISGENSQKLVEYTSKENVAFLQDAAAKDAADFLVITICR